MTDETLIAYGGDILANAEDRSVTGLLIPYGEVGRTNAGPFTVEAGAIEIPADPEVVNLNTDHDRMSPVGRATRLWEEGAGIMATFRFAKTPEGDAALADALNPEGKRRRLSAEFTAVIEAGKAIAGKLAAAAQVEAGAFPSARILASEIAEAETPDLIAEIKDAVSAVLEQHRTQTPEAAPAEDNPEEEAAVSATAEVQAGAQAPATLVPQATTKEIGLAEIYASIANYRNTRDADAFEVLAALSDIKTSGAGALPAVGVLQSNWAGRAWQGRRYQRKYITLGKQGTSVSLAGRKAFKIDQGTAVGGDWAGNKAAVPSGTASTSVIESTRKNFAFAADIAREFFDLPGGEEVIQAFVEGVVDSYAKWSDAGALASWVAAAGSPVAPETYPSGYAPALGMLIQGIEAINDVDDTPSFGIVNKAAFSQLLYSVKDAVPEFVNFSVNTEGTAITDGNVHIVKAPDSAFAGLAAGAPAVIVGAQAAIEFDEIGENPLQIDALDIAKGGVDKAFHGYLQTLRVRDESVVLLGTPAAP